MTKRMARMSCKSFLEMPCTAKHVLQPGEETNLYIVKEKGGGKEWNTSWWLESSLLFNAKSILMIRKERFFWRLLYFSCALLVSYFTLPLLK
jgi:hypothetical protein